MATSEIVTLSILLPVLNEEVHLQETISTILSNKSVDYELVICDNKSVDNTLGIAWKFRENDSRVKVYSQKERVSSVENWWAAFNYSVGDYVFFMGGHDLLERGVIDQIIHRLDGRSILLTDFSEFEGDDETVHRRDLKLDEGFSDNIIDIMLNSNEDDVILSFIPRTRFVACQKLKEGCLESMAWWWIIICFYRQNVVRTKLLAFHRRTDSHKLSGYAGNDENRSKYLFVATARSAFNSVVVGLVLRDFKSTWLLLLKNRRHLGGGGFFGKQKRTKKRYFFFGPVQMLLIAPLLDLIKLAFSFLRSFQRNQF